MQSGRKYAMDAHSDLLSPSSFMWSFEKLHRCMAHLFLGQLVSTFDEEFRILYAQSQPLMIEEFSPMEGLSLSKKRQYPSDRQLYREPKKFPSMDPLHPEEWPRRSSEERTDWRMMPPRKEAMHGPTDVYGRFISQQPRMDPAFDPGPSKMPMMENPGFKRHGYVEDAPGRHSYPFLQQGMPEPENQGRPPPRGQQPGPGPGTEAEYSGYNKFWNQDFYSSVQDSEPGLPQEMEPHDNFDPVLNYLSSTTNADFDQGSDKILPASDLSFGSSHTRRLNVGQPHASQTSPSPSNASEQDPNVERKDPQVKQGLRNWRISSYLSAYDNPAEEGLPSEPLDGPDAFEEPSNPIQQTPGINIYLPKIPNVREFRVPAIPRASQMPSYAKTNVQEQPSQLPDEPIAVQTTPTPSESSSSTTDMEKMEEGELKEPKTSALRREESFRRKYNVVVPRSSRLRSSMIFSSLDQQHSFQDTKTALDQPDEDADKTEAEQIKAPFALGQRRATTREPIEWSRFMKSSALDSSATDPSKPEDGNSKQGDKDSPKDDKSKDPSEAQEPLKPAAEDPCMPQSKPRTVQAEQPPGYLLSTPFYMDMSDPDNRLMFFKELAAKRKASLAAGAEKSNEKAPMKPPTELKDNTADKNVDPLPKASSEKIAGTSIAERLLDKNVPAEDSGETVPIVSPSVDACDNKQSSQVKTGANTPQSSHQEPTRVSARSEEIELKNQSAATLPVSAQTEATQSKQPEEPGLATAAVRESSSSPPPAPPQIHSTPPHATPSSASVAQGPDGSETSAASVAQAETVSSHVTPEGSSSTPPSSTLSLHAQDSSSPSAPEPSQLTSSENLSAADPPHVESDVSPPAGLEANTSSSQSRKETDSEPSGGPTPSKQDVPESEDVSAPKGVGEMSPDLGPSKNLEAGSTPPRLSPSLPGSSLQNVSELESKSIPSPNDTITSPPSTADTPPKLIRDNKLSCPPSNSSCSPVRNNKFPCPPSYSSCSSVRPNKLSCPPSYSSCFPSEKPATPPSEPEPTVSPTPVETVSCSPPLAEAVGAVLSPEAETILTALHSPSDTACVLKQVATDSTEASKLPATETLSPTELASKVPTEPALPGKTPECVTPEPPPADPPVSAEHVNLDRQSEANKEPERPDPGEIATGDTEAAKEVNKASAEESACNDETNEHEEKKPPEVPSGDVVPAVPQSKQPKSSPSRYQSSTANVLSSSNLRDDTKLLLGQISANSQSRIEAAKESPVTDDEKEDEADKNAKREKERGIRSLNRGTTHKTNQEREKLLEKIQTMRKDRKVYSRFEVTDCSMKAGGPGAQVDQVLRWTSSFRVTGSMSDSHL
ncbi:Protein FAM83H [Liparis tanakae]|uniref:Protein FAM83H n=1 Tax=Liparis tanakae TaxID=230148 RepID=A0A4Z2FYR3_9TELE|nr:Protein FAM83H [Liparis tanakae]